MAKFSKDVSSSTPKVAEGPFPSPFARKTDYHVSGLSKELRLSTTFDPCPSEKDDEVVVVRGAFKGAEGKVLIGIYRKKYVIHVDKVTRDKSKLVSTLPKVVISKLYLDKDRKAILGKEKIGEAQRRKCKVD
ncbi:hypothetical protein PGT21_003507 [Puccinia graminis f. sp. tritici]|uniref:KOW domain-containing protein n=1 Tax=Puccinia graminis f. sp. tritici TaxID=56615 RepID=A0A5B0QVJ3_PUCGR|nr:hypothetical protein PGT21_003507 [Puccinia graminis f. sp. tritici]